MKHASTTDTVSQGKADAKPPKGRTRSTQRIGVARGKLIAPENIDAGNDLIEEMFYGSSTVDPMNGIADERALLQLAYRYAQAVDRRDADALVSVFAADGIIARPGSVWQGHEKLRGIIARLNTMYGKTLHTVRNQTAVIDRDAAEGETYCVAMHILNSDDGKRTRMDMGIRYQDSFVRQDGVWRFARRELIVDWLEHTDLTAEA